MGSHLHRPVPEVLREKAPNGFAAPGRLASTAPIAIIDIGSNSVRLVVYENLSRSPTPVFNEKEMAGLGRGVTSTGELAADAVEKALGALERFRILCEAMEVSDIRVIATAAARYARNGPDFITRAEKACGRRIEVISGDREAYLSALGVVSGFTRPDGIVGDLGGGSLELIDVLDQQIGKGVSVPLGGLALQDRSGGSLKIAEKIVRNELENLPQVDAMRGRCFYAVGGTWRALAKLHMRQTNYPLNVMHAYTVPARDVADFAKMVERVDADILESIEAVSSARRPLLAFGALVLEYLIRKGKPKAVIISAQGVREGVLHEQLDPAERMLDPLLQATLDYNVLRSRDPAHAAELIAWVDDFMRAANIDESPEEIRIRHAACHLSDIGWRAHPDYRGEQSLNVISHAAFIGLDHATRAYLSLAAFYRYAGLRDDPATQRLRELLGPRMLERARLLGGVMRVAYLLSAGMHGLLPQMPLGCTDRRVVLHVPPGLQAMASERVAGRLKQLGKLLGRESAILVRA